MIYINGKPISLFCTKTGNIDLTELSRLIFKEDIKEVSEFVSKVKNLNTTGVAYLKGKNVKIPSSDVSSKEIIEAINSIDITPEAMVDFYYEFINRSNTYEYVSVKAGNTINAPVNPNDIEIGPGNKEIFYGWVENLDEPEIITFPIENVTDNKKLYAYYQKSQLERLYHYFNVDKTAYPKVFVVNNNSSIYVIFSETGYPSGTTSKQYKYSNYILYSCPITVPDITNVDLTVSAVVGGNYELYESIQTTSDSQALTYTNYHYFSNVDCSAYCPNNTFTLLI